ncbi:response regulator [Kozakia baliensis]|uniref:response regulator n=1 Tax=Kozakia baliensis TaxID=153496 RepID=UPI00087C816E|nr:response regulator [Kozakia baliensis]AOX19407.1 hypothetical protein A0U90_02850 [Kozakia baliensis]
MSALLPSSTIIPPAVLIVEDQALLRFLAADMVKEAGFTALVAEDATQAIMMMERHPGIRTVFSDIDMPGAMNGLELARYISRFWPPVGIVLTSGMCPDMQGALPPGGIFLPKPYLFHEVTAALHRLVH